MSDETYIPFGEIVVELKKLCDAGKTGVLFLATRKNKSAQIMLDGGNIVFVYFFNRRGVEALTLMLEIEAGRFRFQEGSITAKPMDLPPTADILQNLMNGAGMDAVSATTTSTTASAQISDQVASSLSPDHRRELEDALAKYIGPMASIICDDHLDSATDLHAAIDALASEIPAAEKAAQFKAEAQQRLGV